MQKNVSHIAKLLFMIFVVCFIQPYEFSFTKFCSSKTLICYKKVYYRQADVSQQQQLQKKTYHPKAVMVIASSCEILIATAALSLELPVRFFRAIKSFFYKADIHSPPYLQLITPPPNALNISDIWIKFT